MYHLEFDRLHNYSDRTVPIWLKVGLGVDEPIVSFDAKVDTGADHCVFAREYGEIIGLQIEHGEHNVFTTATGSFEAFGHTVKIWACNEEVEATVYFFKATDIKKNVLGLTGWIDRFTLGIDHSVCSLYLKRRDTD